MRYSCHSVHEPECPICEKHCMTLESVREHLKAVTLQTNIKFVYVDLQSYYYYSQVFKCPLHKGSLAKSNCSAVCTALGCKLCLSIFGSTDARNLHEACCRMNPPSISVT